MTKTNYKRAIHHHSIGSNRLNSNAKTKTMTMKKDKDKDNGKHILQENHLIHHHSIGSNQFNSVLINPQFKGLSPNPFLAVAFSSTKEMQPDKVIGHSSQ